MATEAIYDLLIHNGLVVTVDEVFSILDGGAVAIRHGRIAKVWRPDDPRALPAAREVLDARGGMVMPGLVNAHTHLPMTLFRGLADDLPLSTWLHEHIFPAETRWIDPPAVRLGTRLACAEMLLNGITTCCDGYFLADAVADAVAGSGLRAVIGQGIIDFPAPGVPDPAQNVAHARAFARAWLNRTPLVQPSLFCHAPYTCGAATLRAAKQAADDLGVLFQIHVAETREEVDQCRKAHACTPVAWLHRLGVLDARTLVVHAVWLDDADIGLLADSGAVVAHCPESNMKLGSGIAPVPDLIAAGITVALGTDGCASNNDLDLFAEMDTAAKLHKVHRLDPTVMDAQTVLRMATVQGARALGLQDRIGSLAPGRQADLIVLDGQRPHLTPLYHPASHLVYAAGGDDVRHVLIDGRWVVRDRRLLTDDLAALLDQAAALGRAIAAQHGRRQ